MEASRKAQQRDPQSFVRFNYDRGETSTETETRLNGGIKEISTNWNLVYLPVLIPIKPILGYYPAYWRLPNKNPFTADDKQIKTPTRNFNQSSSTSAARIPESNQKDRHAETSYKSNTMSGEISDVSTTMDCMIDETQSKIKSRKKRKSEKSVSKPPVHLHKCPQCRAEYKKRFQLNRHVKVTHIRPHVCDVCSKRFGHINYLRQHIANVHNKQRNFKCSQCGKLLSTNGNLILHIQTLHQGKRQHKCPICQVRFAQLGNLGTHIRRHHKE